VFVLLFFPGELGKEKKGKKKEKKKVMIFAGEARETQASLLFRGLGVFFRSAETHESQVAIAIAEDLIVRDFTGRVVARDPGKKIYLFAGLFSESRFFAN